MKQPSPKTTGAGRKPPRSGRRRRPRGERGEEIREPGRVAHLLRQLVQNRSLIRAGVAGGPCHYLSALLKVDDASRYCLVDELTPSEGHAKVAPGVELTFRAKLAGVELSFAGPVEAVGRQGGVALYRLALPSSVRYMQRRAHYRGHVNGARVVRVDLGPDGEHAVHGELRDISVGGFCAKLNDWPGPAVPGPDHPLSECTIVLPDDTEIRCRIRIRRLDKGKRPGHYTLGAEFTDLGPREDAAIQRFIAFLDREMAKKRPR